MGRRELVALKSGDAASVIVPPVVVVAVPGFLGRNNYEEVWAWVQYRTTKEWWIVRKTWNNLNLGFADNLDVENVPVMTVDHDQSAISRSIATGPSATNSSSPSIRRRAAASLSAR